MLEAHNEHSFSVLGHAGNLAQSRMLWKTRYPAARNASRILSQSRPPFAPVIPYTFSNKKPRWPEPFQEAHIREKQQPAVIGGTGDTARTVASGRKALTGAAPPIMKSTHPIPFGRIS